MIALKMNGAGLLGPLVRLGAMLVLALGKSVV